MAYAEGDIKVHTRLASNLQLVCLLVELASFLLLLSKENLQLNSNMDF